MTPQLVELVNAVARAGAGFFVQSTIVIGLTLLGTRLFAKSSALRSACYRAAVVALLALPAVALLLCVAGASRLSLAMPEARVTVVQVEPLAKPVHVPTPKVFSVPVPETLRRPMDVPPTATSSPPPRRMHPPAPPTEEPDREPRDAFADPSAPERVASQVAVQDAPSAPSEAGSAEPVAVEGPSIIAITEVTGWTYGYAAFALLWVFGAGMLLLRLGLAHLWLSRVCRRARRVTDKALIAESESLAARMGVRPPRLRISRSVGSPVLTGLLQPTVLLPAHDVARYSGEQRRAVLLHELAHQARRDCLMNFFGTLLRAVGFIQPLVWVLTRRMERAADEVVDDVVLAGGVSGTGYARSLMRMAERLTPRRADTVAGVGVIGFRSALGQRVVRILNSARDAATRLSRRAALAIVAAVAAAGLLAASIGIVHSGSASAEPDAAKAITPRSCERMLPGGVGVSLVGVSRHPSKATTWWAPNGGRLPDAPLDPFDNPDQEVSHDDGRLRLRRFALRLDHLPAEPVGVRMHMLTREGRHVLVVPRVDGRAAPGFRSLLAEFFEPTDAGTLCVGVASGPWKSWGEWRLGPAPAKLNRSSSPTSFRFERHDSKNGQARVTVSRWSHEDEAYQTRFMAIDPEGRPHVGAVVEDRMKDRRRFVTARFPGLPLDQVKEFRFEVRPYEWTRFQDVSLAAGHETKPQAVPVKPAEVKLKSVAWRWLNNHHARAYFGIHADGDRRSYRIGETVRLTCLLKNEGTKPFEFTSPAAAHLPWRFMVDRIEGRKAPEQFVQVPVFDGVVGRMTHRVPPGGRHVVCRTTLTLRPLDWKGTSHDPVVRVKPGTYRVTLDGHFRNSRWLTGEFRFQVLPADPNAEPDGPGWGEPSHGVACRVRAPGLFVNHGETPVFTLDARNEAPTRVHRGVKSDTCLLQFDGRWYARPGMTDVSPFSLQAGGRLSGVPIRLDRQWRRQTDGQPLQLTEGHHRIRLAFVAPTERLRIQSNAIGIQVLPPGRFAAMKPANPGNPEAILQRLLRRGPLRVPRPRGKTWRPIKKTDQGFEVIPFPTRLVDWMMTPRLRDLDRDADVKALLAHGPRIADLLNKTLAEIAPDTVAADRLSYVLAHVGNRESVAVLIGLLGKCGTAAPNWERAAARHDVAMRTIWALWELTGRALEQGPVGWERWGAAVKDGFVPARDRHANVVTEAQVRKRVDAFVGQPEKRHDLVRESLVVMGPGVVPHLLAMRDAAGPLLWHHFDWIIDETGGAVRMPREQRRAYFTRRLKTEKLGSELGKRAARRAFGDQPLADACSMAVEVERHRKGDGARSVMFASFSQTEMPKHMGAFGRRMIPPALPIIIAAIQDDSPAVRRFGVDMIGLIYFHALRFGPTELTPMLVKRSKAEPVVSIRADLAKLITRHRSPQVAAAVQAGLMSKKPGLLLDSLTQIGGQAWLFDPKKDKGVFDRIVALTANRDDSIREAAVGVLHERAKDRLRLLLDKLYRDPAQGIRKKCVHLMQWNPKPEDTKRLIVLLDDPVWFDIRRMALVALGHPMHRAALPRLADLVKSEGNWSLALTTVVRIGGPEATTVVIEGVRAGHRHERFFKALRQLTGEGFETPKQWLAWWDKRPVAATWGKPVEGLQCRIWSDHTRWSRITPRTFRAVIRNRGAKAAKVVTDQAAWQLQFDGQWYRWSPGGGSKPVAFRPGATHENIRFWLCRNWVRASGGEPIVMTAGRHRVRVALVAQPAEAEGDAVRFESNEAVVTFDDASAKRWQNLDHALGAAPAAEREKARLRRRELERIATPISRQSRLKPAERLAKMQPYLDELEAIYHGFSDCSIGLRAAMTMIDLTAHWEQQGAYELAKELAYRYEGYRDEFAIRQQLFYWTRGLRPHEELVQALEPLRGALLNGDRRSSAYLLQLLAEAYYRAGHRKKADDLVARIAERFPRSADSVGKNLERFRRQRRTPASQPDEA